MDDNKLVCFIEGTLYLQDFHVTIVSDISIFGKGSELTSYLII